MTKIEKLSQKLIDLTIERVNLIKNYNEAVKKALVDSSYYKKEDIEKFDKYTKVLENSQHSLMILATIWVIDHPTSLKQLENINYEEYKETYKLNEIELTLFKLVCEKVKNFFENVTFIDENFTKDFNKEMSSIVLKNQEEQLAEIGISLDDYVDMQNEAENYYENISGINLFEDYANKDDEYEDEYNNILNKLVTEFNKLIESVKD